MKTTKQMQKELQEKFPFLELHSEYTGANNKCIIYCTDCGYEWSAIPRSVKNSKFGCPKCKRKEFETNEAKIRFLEKFNSNLFELIEYKDYLHVSLKCKTCGYIRITNANNIYKYGCPKCGQERTHNSQKLTKQDFLDRSKNIHGDKYDYSKVDYINWTTPVIITCKKHGDFAQMPGKHIIGQGCPKCKTSKGESLVEKILKELQIPFNTQVFIENPYGSRNFKVDFYIELNNNKYIIEYNGQQHYIPVKHWGGQAQLITQNKRDQDLRKYCETNNIKLLEIKYDCLDIKNKIVKFINIAV